MIVLITGADQGLGKFVVARLQNLGHTVHTIPNAIMRQGKAAIERQMLYRPDVIINNFGINHLSWIGETPPEDEEILRVNVMGPYWVINAAVAKGWTGIRAINIASQTYRIPQRCTSIYCASKAALVQMTRVMARELADKGWVINALAPGKIVETRMSELTDEQVNELRGWDPADADEYARKLIPMGRFTTKHEVWEAIQHMMEMPAYINGAVIDMMGGV